MPEALGLPSLTAAAARAASEDDIPRAATLLRQAVELQTTTLGPDHPDVATTLNNLALMLEKLGHVKEAGRCYRRAHAIAAAALSPDDPVVQVSRANLDAFRATYAQPVEGEDSAPIDPSVWGDLGDFPSAPAEPAPTAPPARRAATAGMEADAGAVAEAASAEPGAGAVTQPWRTPALELDAEAGTGPRPEPTVAPEVDREEELPLAIAPPAEPPPAPPRTSRPAPTPTPALPSAAASVQGRRGTSPVFVVVMALLAWAVGWWFIGPELPAPGGAPDAAETRIAPSAPEAGADTPSVPAASATTSPTVPSPAASAPPSPASASATAGTSSPAPGAPRLGTAPTGAAATGAAARPPSPSPTRPAANGSPGVAVAQLCSALSRARNPWTCQPAGSPVGSGAVYYYTRVRATRDMTIRHRWTLDGRVVQDVRLRIRANPTDGFRTFSRQTVRGPGAGTWVVTLLGPNGETLDEKSFEVR